MVTQSLKTLSGPVQKWALEPLGWYREGDLQPIHYDLRAIDEEKERDSIFYKEQVVRIGSLDQRMIVTYSIKSRDYQRAVRQRQIDRAVRTVQSHPEEMDRRNQNDYRRLVQMSFLTEEGEISSKRQLNIDKSAIRHEEQFDGFYGVCTNILPPSESHPDGMSTLEILRINHMRWQIEDCFRDLKSHFHSRPVYLSRENRIKAHFLLCCLSLILLKYVEKAVNEHLLQTVPTEAILSHLRGLEMLQCRSVGYLPAFKPSLIQTALQDSLSIPLDSEITTTRMMKKILQSIRKN